MNIYKQYQIRRASFIFDRFQKVPLLLSKNVSYAIQSNANQQINLLCQNVQLYECAPLCSTSVVLLTLYRTIITTAFTEHTQRHKNAFHCPSNIILQPVMGPNYFINRF